MHSSWIDDPTALGTSHWPIQYTQHGINVAIHSIPGYTNQKLGIEIDTFELLLIEAVRR
jgi:hypothetical protein